MIPQPSVHLVLLVVIAAAAGAAASADAGDRTRGDRDLSPLPRRVAAPERNPTTPAKVLLGRRLFFDPRLSGDNQTSCATCHAPDKAFADAARTARGVAGRSLARNTPTLLNVGFRRSFFWDGRETSLERQALVPIRSPDEMNQDLDELVHELEAVPDYSRRFQAVFGGSVSADRVGDALAAFQRTLVADDSPLDRYLGGDEDALSADAKAGLELFVGDAGCVRCHGGPLLSDGKFYRLGIGRGDKGRGAVTADPDDLYKFRTPSLREVARTAPYMHDGSLATLDDVVTFYYRGVPSSGPEGLPLDVESLSSNSFSDIPLLVAFLKSLTGVAPEIEAAETP